MAGASPFYNSASETNPEAQAAGAFFVVDF